MICQKFYKLVKKSRKLSTNTDVFKYCATTLIIVTYIGQHHTHNPIRAQYEFGFRNFIK